MHTAEDIRTVEPVKTEQELYKMVYDHYFTTANADEGKTIREYLEPHIEDYNWLSCEQDSFLDNYPEVMSRQDQEEWLLLAEDDLEGLWEVQGQYDPDDESVYQGIDHFWQVSREVLEAEIEKEEGP